MTEGFDPPPSICRRKSFFRYFESLIDPFQSLNPTFNAKSYKSLIKALFKNNKAAFLTAFLSTIMLSASEVYVVQLSGTLIDLLTSSPHNIGNEDHEKLKHFIITLVIILIILRPATKAFNLLLINQSLSLRISMAVRWHLYKRTLTNPMSFFSSYHSGYLVSTLWQAGQAYSELVVIFLQSLLSGLSFFILSSLVMTKINPAYFIPLFLWLTCYLTLARIQIPKIQNSARRAAIRSNKLNGKMVDVISRILIVKLFNGEKNDKNYMRLAFQKFITKSSRYARTVSTMEFLMVILSSCTLLFVSIITVWLWNANAITGGEAAIVFGLIYRSESLFTQLMGQLTSMQRAAALLTDSIKTLSVSATSSVKAKQEAQAFDRVPTIELCDIHLRYKNKFVFKGLNLTIAPGEKIGIIGASGSGKSTLFRLLLALQEPDSGTIKINGEPIERIAENCLRSTIGLVCQEGLLFNQTVASNILYGLPDGNLDSVLGFLGPCQQGGNQEWAKAKGAARTAIPLDSVVGEQGSCLSGGQRQRINIARTLLAEHKVILLDEATSALDTLSEGDIIQLLSEHLKEKTVIMASHRVETLKWMDRIIILKEGKIVQSGTYEDLIENNRYREILKDIDLPGKENQR